MIEKTQTIQAQVSTRLLSKASRLFTGTLDGRIIEILQNARRAGATQVTITNEDGLVSVRDNGSGIDDFAKLLDLGDSDWDQAMKEAEDPAGVGIFCLAPRKVTICSNGKRLVITKDGWTGTPLELAPIEDICSGTELVFTDEPWELKKVQRHAVFSGMKVIVDGKTCPQQPFTSSRAAHYPELGCRIEVRDRDRLNEWHRQWREHYYSDTILVSFHGQIVNCQYSPLSEDLVFLVDMTGEATGIRMMLPARTQLIENKVFEALKTAIEIEAYRFIQRRGSHKLPFAEYKRAGELGIKLPEAEPVFAVGLLCGDTPEPVAVFKPEDLPLARCYRFDEDSRSRETDEANAHLLAALGKFNDPFVPVTISSSYDGYSWAGLPTIGNVDVTVGKELGRQGIWCETLVAVESLKITVHTSDKKVFTSNVCMAVLEEPAKERNWGYTNVYVTPESRSSLGTTDIWYHLGGWSDEGDTWDTQVYEVEQEIEHFWATIIGPAEYLWSKIRESLCGIVKDWKTIVFEDKGILTIRYNDGTEKVYKSPQSSSGAT
ncbi:MAG: hypothetical protein ACYTDV_19890 [Planctomycetota bacterium]|jgi:hypothetical protein